MLWMLFSHPLALFSEGRDHIKVAMMGKAMFTLRPDQPSDPQEA